MTVRSAWLTTNDQTRQDTRLTLSGLLTINASAAENVPLKARGGIVPGGFALTGTTGAMTFTIGTGRAFVQSGRILQGAYPVAVTDPEPLTVPDGDAQYGRIDLVELAVLDDEFDGTGSTTALVRLVQGTPAATPTAPNTPNGNALPSTGSRYRQAPRRATAACPGPRPSPTSAIPRRRWAESSRHPASTAPTPTSTGTPRARSSAGTARRGCRIPRPSAVSHRSAR